MRLNGKRNEKCLLIDIALICENLLMAQQIKASKRVLLAMFLFLLKSIRVL